MNRSYFGMWISAQCTSAQAGVSACASTMPFRSIIRNADGNREPGSSAIVCLKSINRICAFMLFQWPREKKRKRRKKTSNKTRWWHIRQDDGWRFYFFSRCFVRFFRISLLLWPRCSSVCWLLGSMGSGLSSCNMVLTCSRNNIRVICIIVDCFVCSGRRMCVAAVTCQSLDLFRTVLFVIGVFLPPPEWFFQCIGWKSVAVRRRRRRHRCCCCSCCSFCLPFPSHSTSEPNMYAFFLAKQAKCIDQKWSKPSNGIMRTLICKFCWMCMLNSTPTIQISR